MTSERVQLGVDGTACFALLGPDLQQGEVECVELPKGNESSVDAQLSCCKVAFRNLKARLNMPLLSFYFGPSHPYGS